MKNFRVLNAMIVVLFILALVVNVAASAETLPEDFAPNWVVNHNYAKVAVIDKMDYENDLVYFAIPFGDDYFHYVYEGIEDLDIGDVCALLMHDNNTSYIMDDIVISVTYSGFTSNFGGFDFE